MNELVKGCKMPSISLMKIARGIHQLKRHDQPFKKALLGFEGSLPHIEGFNRHVVITRLQVNIAKIFRPLELVQKFIKSWDWVPIPYSDLVQCLIVNTESLGPILLQFQ